MDFHLISNYQSGTYILFLWLHWVFIAALGLSLVSLRCMGLLRWLLLLWSTGSRCTGFSSCGTWAQ